MNGTTSTKTEHPADGSPRWIVVGDAGRVVYDTLGNHLAVIPADGDIDPVMGKTLARVREYALLGEDDVVFQILGDVYRTELEFGAIVATSYTNRRCRRCGATQGLKALYSGLGYSRREWECFGGCKGGLK